MQKTGYIAIVGRPNVGKSTILNSILGEKVAIVSNKPQTTRNRIIGIHTKGESQFVFLDTPGIHNPKNRLGDYMIKAANTTMQDADAVVYHHYLSLDYLRHLTHLGLLNHYLNPDCRHHPSHRLFLSEHNQLLTANQALKLEDT